MTTNFGRLEYAQEALVEVLRIARDEHFDLLEYIVGMACLEVDGLLRSASASQRPRPNEPLQSRGGTASSLY